MSVFDRDDVAIICCPLNRVYEPKPGSAGVCHHCDGLVWVADTSRTIQRQYSAVLVCSDCTFKKKLLEHSRMMPATPEQWAEFTELDKVMYMALFTENKIQRQRDINAG